MCKYVYMCAYAWADGWVYVCVCLYVGRICVYVCCTGACVCMRVYACVCVGRWMGVCVNMCICVRMRGQVDECMCVYVCMCVAYPLPPPPHGGVGLV